MDHTQPEAPLSSNLWTLTPDPHCILCSFLRQANEKRELKDRAEQQRCVCGQILSQTGKSKKSLPAFKGHSCQISCIEAKVMGGGGARQSQPREKYPMKVSCHMVFQEFSGGVRSLEIEGEATSFKGTDLF